MRPQTIAEQFLFLANSARKVVQADNLKKYYFYILLTPLADGRYPPLVLFTLTPFQHSPHLLLLFTAPLPLHAPHEEHKKKYIIKQNDRNCAKAVSEQ